MADLLVAAVFAAGFGASDDQLLDQVIRLGLMAEEASPFAKRVARVMGASRFVADLVAVELEESSTRAVITLRSDSADSDDGLEQIRTDRTDGPDGRRMAAAARALLDRRVLVFKQIEDIGPQKKVRVCVHLVDLGAARSDPDPSREGPWARRHWEEAAASAGVTPARVLEAAHHYSNELEQAPARDLDDIGPAVGDRVRRWLDRQRLRSNHDANGDGEM